MRYTEQGLRRTVWLDGADWKKLIELAARKRCSGSFLVRQAISRLLTEEAAQAAPRTDG